jgi:hypothetical protein
MYVNRYSLNPGYNISFGRLKIARGLHSDKFVFYDSEGYREAPPSGAELNSILNGLGFWLRVRSRLPAELFAPDGRPLVRSQLPKSNYLLDRDCRKIYLAKANADSFRVTGAKYVCWKPEPGMGPDHIDDPRQKPITVISTKSKKELVAFAAWLQKVQDVNTVVNAMHVGLAKMHFADTSILANAYRSGFSPAVAYAELPEANWTFPDADKFGRGTEVLEVPYITWG